MQPSGIEVEVPTRNLLDPHNLVANKEIVDFLDQNIQAEFRESYLKLKHGNKVSRNDILKLQSHIAELMENKEWINQDLKNEDN
jgi:hypothetical protein